MTDRGPVFDASTPQSLDLKGDGNLDVALLLVVAQVHSSIVVTAASGTSQSTDELSKALTVVDGSTISLRADKSVEALTGAMHFDGLADTAESFGGGCTLADVLRIMRDHAIGSYGAIALVS